MSKKKRRRVLRGQSYAKRVADINDIYDRFAGSGLSNREIWRRYIYPRFGVSERTFSNMLKAPANPEMSSHEDLMGEGMIFPLLFPEEKDGNRDLSYYKKDPE